MVLEHAQQRTIVLPGRKVLFVPMPKAGCTSILWLLADLAGLQDRRFAGSTSPEVSSEMTVHSLSHWPHRFRWSALEPEAQSEIENDRTWLRFTVVRDPAHRVFSAWQSKCLMREPRFVDRFGDDDWFPRLPSSPDDIVADFRTFVHALADTAPSDGHWAPQSDILRGGPDLNFIGRAEDRATTYRQIRRHLGNANALPATGAGQKNQSLVRYTPSLFDAETAAIVNELYGADFDAFGYQPLDSRGATRLSTWRADVKPIMQGLREVIRRNERIRTLLAETAASLEELRAENRRLAEEQASPPAEEPASDEDLVR